jgi:catechol 2,3-dioxygenase-like lactoylglutathione lyase family enzyme
VGFLLFLPTAYRLLVTAFLSVAPRELSSVHHGERKWHLERHPKNICFDRGGTGASMSSSVQIEQKTYQMPPREGMSIAHFLTVADIQRSARFYEKVFGARILSLGDGNAPAYLQLANIWMILNIGGGPTPDKPTVTLSVPDPNHINSFMNFRVADIQACYELWKSRGAEFITEPIPKYGETRCYIRDPDGYIIEIGQSTTLTYG